MNETLSPQPQANHQPPLPPSPKGGEDQNLYDTVDLDDMEYDDIEDTYYYPCPCGDRFEISQSDVDAGVRIALCPSCTLILGVVLEPRQDSS